MARSGWMPNWSGQKVLVIGDLILDHFVRGAVRRISPEAPVPVVEVEDEHFVLGGAANVANNIKALGGTPLLVGAIGDDRSGADFVQLMEYSGLASEGILQIHGRPTSVKTRVIANHQQVVRVDREVSEPVSQKIVNAVKAAILKMLGDCGAAVVSDYAKGLFSPSLLRCMGAACRSAGVPYVVDPKPVHFPYPGATVVTPNRSEARGFYGREFKTEEAGSVGMALLKKTGWDAILMTLGDEGMVLCQKKGPPLHIPAQVREVYDVTGAGDTVVAVMTLGLAARLSMESAARAANAAAGVVVGKVGTAVCTPRELELAMRAGR